MDDVSAWVFDFILFMVVAFAVLNTVQMSVFERTREFGIMLALGNNPAQIVALVMLETLYIALIGLLLGVMLGGGISIWFAWHPLITQLTRKK
jgi:ABC-type antimicrobial peptide transport system permease subunit